MRASFLLSELRVGLRRNLTMTFAVVVTVAVSLAFFGAALLLGKQVEVMKGFWYDKIQVAVFLCGPASAEPGCAAGEVTPEQRTALETRLRALPQVETVFYESKAEAFAHYQEQYAGREIASAVTAEAMPESFRVKLRDPRQASEVIEAMVDRPGVERVDDPRNLLDRLFHLLDGLRYLALTLAVAQVIAGMLLIMNTVRLAAFSRRQETSIMRLVGASNLSIQLPFVLQSALAGLVGALVASGVLLLAQKTLVEDQLRQHYPVTPYIGWAAVWTTLPWIFLLGVGLAALASFLTLRRYLKV
jgi:cell division transport system permease protein